MADINLYKWNGEDAQSWMRRMNENNDLLKAAIQNGGGAGELTGPEIITKINQADSAYTITQDKLSLTGDGVAEALNNRFSGNEYVENTRIASQFSQVPQSNLSTDLLYLNGKMTAEGITDAVNGADGLYYFENKNVQQPDLHYEKLVVNQGASDTKIAEVEIFIPYVLGKTMHSFIGITTTIPEGTYSGDISGLASFDMTDLTLGGYRSVYEFADYYIDSSSYIFTTVDFINSKHINIQVRIDAPATYLRDTKYSHFVYLRNITAN